MSRSELDRELVAEGSYSSGSTMSTRRKSAVATWRMLPAPTSSGHLLVGERLGKPLKTSRLFPTRRRRGRVVHQPTADCRAARLSGDLPKAFFKKVDVAQFAIGKPPWANCLVHRCLLHESSDFPMISALLLRSTVRRRVFFDRMHQLAIRMPRLNESRRWRAEEGAG